MENWRDGWRLLFGQTPVKIKGAFSYDETIDRLNLVISRRFLSSHFRCTLSGGPNDDGRLEFFCGNNFYFMRQVAERTKGWGGAPMGPPIALRFIGDLEIDKGGYVWLRGHLQAGTTERTASILLLLILAGGVLLLPWAYGVGTMAFFAILVALIIVPAVFLALTVVYFAETGKKLIQMLKMVMTEPLE